MQYSNLDGYEVILNTYDWIKLIPSSILKWDETPLLGMAPSFPWKEFSAQIAQVFSIEQLTVTPGDIQWRSPNEYFAGIANPMILFIQAGGVEGSLVWAMSKDEIVAFMRRLLLQGKDPSHALFDEELIGGFYRFAALEALYTISRLKFDPSLPLHLKEEGTLPEGAALCQDISVQLPPTAFSGRLLLSSEFRKSWAQRYAPKTPDAYFQTPLAEKLDLPVQLQAGTVSLRKSEWRSIAPGDFLLLDSCGIEPKTFEGNVALVVGKMTLFEGFLQNGEIRIGEVSEAENIERYKEVAKMKNDDPSSEEDEFVDSFDSDEDFDFDEFDDDEFDEEEETSHEDVRSFKEQPSREKSERKAPAPPSREEPKAAKQEAQRPQRKASPANMEHSSSKGFSSLEDIPLFISVEIGCIHLSIKKLMELAPGNVLELGIRPENGVDLVYHGKCIARGELLRIGDTLGVRIVEKH